MNDTRRVTVVIPSYNGADDLKRCLDALRQTTYPLSIIVVDNASSDGSVDLARSKFSGVKLVKLDRNIGFAGACLKGWEEARKDSDYIALVNQDLIVTPGWLRPLVDELNEHSRVVAAQPFILRDQDREVVNSFGNEINFLGFGFSGGNGLSIADTRVQRRLSKTQEVTYASGAAVLLRVGEIERLGLFLEDFFMYHEDLDLGWRIRLAGMISTMVPDSKVYHRYEFHRSTPVKYEFGERNRLLVLLMNYHILTLFFIFPAWFIVEIGVVTMSLMNGWLLAKIRGYIYILNNFSKIMDERKRRKKLRSVSERQVVRGFTGGVYYQEGTILAFKIANPFLRAYWALVRLIMFW